MKRRRLTAGLVAVALGVGFLAGRDTSVAAQGQGRVLEIRTYVTPDRTGLDNLVKRMKDESKIFDRLGMKGTLYSVAVEAPQSENTFVYILAHESREKAKEKWTGSVRTPSGRSSNHRGIPRTNQDPVDFCQPDSIFLR